MGNRGCASHPGHPKIGSHLGGAGRNSRPLTTAPRGGRGPSLASLVALGRSLTLAHYSILRKLRYSSIGPKGIFFTNDIIFKSNTFFPTRLSWKQNIVKTGPYDRTLAIDAIYFTYLSLFYTKGACSVGYSEIFRLILSESYIREFFPPEFPKF